MGLREDRARFEQAGLGADFHWWERGQFRKTVKAVLAALDADPAARPCLTFGLSEKGVVTAWLYAESPSATAKGDGDPPGGDESFPCPPICG